MFKVNHSEFEKRKKNFIVFVDFSPFFLVVVKL